MKVNRPMTQHRQLYATTFCASRREVFCNLWNLVLYFLRVLSMILYLPQHSRPYMEIHRFIQIANDFCDALLNKVCRNISDNNILVINARVYSSCVV